MTRLITAAGLTVTRTVESVNGPEARETLIDRLDAHPGLLLSSGTEYPGRYTRFDIGFSDPPLRIEGRGRTVRIAALNQRGLLLRDFAESVLGAEPLVTLGRHGDVVTGHVASGAEPDGEDQRTRQPSLFTVVRRLLDAFRLEGDDRLGLYGAFGYDLVFQFEAIRRQRERPADQRDLVLYVPDRIFRHDIAADRAEIASYDFAWEGRATDGLARVTAPDRFVHAPAVATADHAPGEYVATVERARRSFARGDLFEVVPGQLQAHPVAMSPARVFRRLAEINPAPYGALINLGEGEFLVSASPEMFVRSDGRRVETCPISGTIARGADAAEDARNIATLINSAKDEYELNMCTDVDRNDKARVCEPGTVKVIGRRQIEMYARVIHTVDHVEGVLRADRDVLDAFLSHAWAVTVTGAPKLWAMQFIEDHEKSCRRWYGGAIGAATFDGGMNTGLTIRTIRMKDGLAEVRAGATLLYDSDPKAEDRECALKASALLQALNVTGAAAAPARPDVPRTGSGKRMLLVDCEDSFVHMLADYFRRTGAEVDVVRHTQAAARLDAGGYDLLGLSPGPGRPEDFRLGPLIDRAVEERLPVFGVCLGMQALAQHFGGALAQLATPVHGRPSRIVAKQSRLFAGAERDLTVGRYHSLHVDEAALPPALRVTARSEDGVAMALEHRDLPIAAVQFHPESIMSAEGDAGLRIIAAAVAMADATR